MNVYAIPGITRTIGEAAIDFRLSPDQKHRKIEHAVCSVWQLTPSKLHERTRKRKIVEARQLVFWYMTRLTKLSLADIGFIYGEGYDHATVLHAKKTVNNMRDTNQEFREKLEQVEAQMKLFLSAEN